MCSPVPETRPRRPAKLASTTSTTARIPAAHLGFAGPALPLAPLGLDPGKTGALRTGAMGAFHRSGSRTLGCAAALLALLAAVPSFAQSLASALTLEQTLELDFGPVVRRGDRIGVSVARIGDLDGDGIDELAFGAPGSDDGANYAGAVHILFFDRTGRLRGDQRLSATDGGVAPVPTASTGFGWSLAPLGDLDGDGIPDLAVGSGYTAGAGSIWILHLNADGSAKTSTLITRGDPEPEPSPPYGNGFGFALAGLGDLDGDGSFELAVGAPFDDEAAAQAGAVWILSLDAAAGVVSESRIVPDGSGLFAVQNENGWFGISLATLADRNGDGRPELAVGAEGDSLSSSNHGAVHIVSLDAAGVPTAAARYDATTPALVGLFDSYDGFATSLLDAGDLDGNGTADLLVGIASKDINTSSVAFNDGSVAALFFDGGDIVGVTEISLEEGDIAAVSHSMDNFGQSLAAVGDVDGDGLDEIAIGAPATFREDGSVDYGGRMFLAEVDASFAVLGHREFDFDISEARNFTQFGESGAAGAGPGDPSADGQNDLWGGAPALAPSGDVLVLVRGDDERIARYRAVASSDAGLAAALPAGARFGTSVAVLPDLDADTVPEMVVGAPEDPGAGARRGSAWILRPDAEGLLHGFARIGETSGGFSGALADDDAFGTSVAVIEDLDGNGVGEIVVGAPGSDGGAGAVWLLFLDAGGAVTSQHRIDGTTPALAGLLDAGGAFGTNLVAVGDVDGDDNDDIAVGAPLFHGAETDAGAIYVLFLLADGSVRDATRISAGENGWEQEESTDAQLGSLMLTLGDRDGDGIRDLVVAAHRESSEGIYEDHHALFLAGDGTVRQQHRISGAHYLTSGYFRAGPFFAAGDLTGDGRIDLVHRNPAYGMLYASGFTSRCGPEPLAGCRGAAKHGLKIRNRPGGRGDSLLWKWGNGDQTDLADFADPAALETYAICIWDARGGDYELVSEAVLYPYDLGPWLSGATNRLEWRATAGTDIDGVRLVKLLVKPQGKGRMSVQAKGEFWPAPRAFSATALFAADPETVIQFRDESGQCWESRYSDLFRNEAERVNAKFP